MRMTPFAGNVHAESTSLREGDFAGFADVMILLCHTRHLFLLVIVTARSGASIASTIVVMAIPVHAVHAVHAVHVVAVITIIAVTSIPAIIHSGHVAHATHRLVHSAVMIVIPASASPVNGLLVGEAVLFPQLL